MAFRPGRLSVGVGKCQPPSAMCGCTALKEMMSWRPFSSRTMSVRWAMEDVGVSIGIYGYEEWGIEGS